MKTGDVVTVVAFLGSYSLPVDPLDAEICLQQIEISPPEQTSGLSLEIDWNPEKVAAL